MEDQQEPLTDIEQSRADTGFRYYVVQPDELYTGLVAAVDSDRGYPNKQGTTITGLPPVANLAEATDGSGRLIAIDCWRFTANDDAILEDAEGVQELTQLEFLSIKPQPTEDLS
jgi:hypothetical protein